MPNKSAAQTAPTTPPKAASKAAAQPKAGKPLSRAELCKALAEQTGLAPKDVARVLDALAEQIGKELGKKGPGQFVLPGLLKLEVVRKAATKARPGRNPHTGEAITLKARPARNVVRARPLKGLKDMV